MSYTRAFLSAMVPDTAHYCIFHLKNNNNPRNYFSTSLDDIIHKTLKLTNEGHDVYFALGSFYTDGARTQRNVARMKAVYIDLDVWQESDSDEKKAKKYPNQKAAYQALKAFCKKVGLPKPVIVNSGNGLHCYWYFDKAIEVIDWQFLANKLKRLCVAEGLKIDPSVTADCARVLRAPGTLNYKDPKNPRSVEILGEPRTFLRKPITAAKFNTLLGNDTTESKAVSMVSDEVRAKFGDSSLNKLSANVKYSFTKYIKALKNNPEYGCKQFNHFLQHQNDQSEPVWHSMLSIVKLIDDPEQQKKAAHFVSKNHSGYSAEETDRKLDSLNDERKGHRCETFEDRNPGGCEGCPHKGKINSPARFFAEVIEATEEDRTVEVADSDVYVKEDGTVVVTDTSKLVIPEFPKPFFRGKNGGIYRRVKSDADDGTFDDVVVYSNDVYSTGLINDPDEGFCLATYLHLPMDGRQEIILPLSSVNALDKFRHIMSFHGVAASQDVMKSLQFYMLAWASQLQQEHKAAEARRQFGWHDNDSCFVIGAHSYHRNGDVTHNAPTRATAKYIPHFSPTGSMEKWKNTVAVFNEPGADIHRFAVCLGFASILGPFVPNQFAAVHLYSQGSGFGKTTALAAYMGIWGNPRETMGIGNDTLNSRMNRMSLFKNLPTAADDLHSLQQRELTEFLLSYTQGRQKSRMTGSSNQERDHGDTWSMTLLSTGNERIMEAITAHKGAAEAEAMRVLELNLNRWGTSIDPKDRDMTVLFELERNFGWAGRVMVQYTISHLPEIIKAYDAVVEALNSKVALEPKHRYIVKTVASTLTMGMIAHKLNLIPYDMKQMFDWCITVLQTFCTQVEEELMGLDDMLTTFLHEHNGSTLNINSTVTLSTNNPMIPNAHIPKGAIELRYEPDVRRIFIPVKTIKKWCHDNKIVGKELLDYVKQQPGYEYITKRLGAGTNIASQAVKCHSFTLDFEADNEDAPTRQAVKEHG